MRSAFITLAAVVVLGTLVAPAQAEHYKNEKLGFELKTPKKWRTMPMATDTDWKVAQFLCNRDYELSDVETGFYTSITPNIDVIVIPHSVRERGGARVEEKDDEIIIHREAPWKNLKEYLEQNCKSIGGFHFLDEETDEINGLKVTKYTIVVDKLVTGERRVYGWAFEGEDAQWGLVSHIFAKHEKKLRPDIERAFRSFKLFPRTGSLPNAAQTGERISFEDPEEERKLTPEQRKEKRDAAVRRLMARIEESIDRSWSVRETKNFIVVSHADKRFTKGISDHAEALRKWLDDTLGYIGDGYVGKCVLRVFADRDEYNAYVSSRGWFSDTPEILTYKDEGWALGGFWSLNNDLYDAWMRDKAPQLRWGAPRWLESGISNLVSNCRSKKGKVVLVPSVWDIVELKKAAKAGTLTHVRDFFTLTSDELWADNSNWAQSKHLAEFLLVGKASRTKRYRDTLATYFAALTDVLKEEEAKEEEAEEFKEPQSEEEEDQMYRDRQTRWRQQEKDKLNAILERAFGEWTDKDWDKLNKMYLRELK